MVSYVMGPKYCFHIFQKRYNVGNRYLSEHMHDEHYPLVQYVRHVCQYIANESYFV